MRLTETDVDMVVRNYAVAEMEDFRKAVENWSREHHEKATKAISYLDEASHKVHAQAGDTLINLIQRRIDSISHAWNTGSLTADVEAGTVSKVVKP